MSSGRAHAARAHAARVRSALRVVAVTILGAVALLAGLVWTPAVADAASRPTLRGTGGAVVSDEQLATAVGLDVLRAGGNAVDGAVATALALAVVSPEAGNLGGGGFAIVRLDPDAEPLFLDFRETAPAAATRTMYLDADGEPVPEASTVGALAVGVPGSPAGLYTLHRRFGRLPWARVVEPARRLAARGFPVSRRMAATLESASARLARFPEAAAVWLPGGAPPPVGSTMRLPRLADTLERYAQSGPSAIHEGAVAAAVADTVQRQGGILTAADLAAYEPVWRQPVRWSGFGWQAATADLPSSGGILLAGAVGMLERIGLETLTTGLGAVRSHRLAEVWRRTYADRFLLGDPWTTEAAAGELLASAWLTRRARAIDLERATPSRAVEPWPGARAEGAAVESLDTTHLSVIDAGGGAVALTTTLNGAFGSGVFVAEAGFFLNNEMDDFAAAPGRPNLYGLVQGEANAVRPGRRMLSSMSPTVAWRDDATGSEVLALGGRGGSRIPTATLQVLLGFVVDHLGLQAAVDRPRVHHQWLPDALFHEPDALSPESLEALAARGHALEVARSLAQVHAARSFVAASDPAEETAAHTPRWHEAAADPRGGGGTAGVVEPLP